MTGRGFVVVRGLPVHDWGEETSAMAYWGIGHHLGNPGAQNPQNELLGHVIDYGEEADNPIVGLMTEALSLHDRCKVLEVGTGSGYQAAILSRLARRVYTLERYRTLLRQAQARFEALKLRNIVTRLGDGGKGWPEQAPFDRIIVTAAAEDTPQALLDQLKPGGVMVAPVGAGDPQTLYRYVKGEDGSIEAQALTRVRFVPLLEGVAKS